MGRWSGGSSLQVLFHFFVISPPPLDEYFSSALVSVQHRFCLFWSCSRLMTTNYSQSHRRQFYAGHKGFLLNVRLSDTDMLMTALGCFGYVSGLIKWRPLLRSDSFKRMVLISEVRFLSCLSHLHSLSLPLMLFHLHTGSLCFPLISG